MTDLIRIIPKGKELLKIPRIRKYKKKYSVRYLSYITGKYKCIPIKKSGVFASKKAAVDWAKVNLRHFVAEKFKILAKHDWRTNSTILRHFNSYSEWRIEENPKSAIQDLSVLSNYGLPFFISVMKESDPALFQGTCRLT